MADIPLSFCTKKLVKPFHLLSESLLSYSSDHTLLDSHVSFSHTWLFNLFLLAPTLGVFSLFLPVKFYPWNPDPWRNFLSQFSQVSLHQWPLSPHLNYLSLCLCCIFCGWDPLGFSLWSKQHWSTLTWVDGLQDTPQRDFVWQCIMCWKVSKKKNPDHALTSSLQEKKK